VSAVSDMASATVRTEDLYEPPDSSGLRVSRTRIKPNKEAAAVRSNLPDAYSNEVEADVLIAAGQKVDEFTKSGRPYKCSSSRGGSYARTVENAWEFYGIAPLLIVHVALKVSDRSRTGAIRRHLSVSARNWNVPL